MNLTFLHIFIKIFHIKIILYKGNAKEEYSSPLIREKDTWLKGLFKEGMKKVALKPGFRNVCVT